MVCKDLSDVFTYEGIDMKSIAIFQDSKGFTKVLEFAQLPHKYSFVEYQPVSLRGYSAEATPTAPIDKEIVFYPKGEATKAYGITTQLYYQTP